MNRSSIVGLLVFVSVTCIASPANAQAPPSTDYKWNVDFGIGWDNAISGNVNSGAMGTHQGQTTVILRNKYSDVYGTGLHLRFGGGYLIKEFTELRATFTFQSLDAELVRMGDFGASNLYGQYDDYQSWGLDVGIRRYIPISAMNVRPYGEAGIGIGFVDELRVALSAPGANLIQQPTDFYDRTAAFTMGVNGGVIFDLTPKTGVFAQLGLRYVTGLSDVDALEGTGLESINGKSARWAAPFSAGVRLRF